MYDGLNPSDTKAEAMNKTPIDKDEALLIAQKQSTPPIEEFQIYDSMPTNWSIYGASADEPGECWYVRTPCTGTGLRSSRAIIISRQTGEVIYDGSANDEG